MAILATAVINNPNYKSWTITALDADTTTTFLHGFAATPDDYNILPQVTYATTALPTWGMTVSSTSVTLLKSSATASGGATPGTTVIAKVWVKTPHSIAQ
jgi:hypothetical protein